MKNTSKLFSLSTLAIAAMLVMSASPVYADNNFGGSLSAVDHVEGHLELVAQLFAPIPHFGRILPSGSIVQRPDQAIDSPVTSVNVVDSGYDPSLTPGFIPGEYFPGYIPVPGFTPGSVPAEYFPGYVAVPGFKPGFMPSLGVNNSGTVTVTGAAASDASSVSPVIGSTSVPGFTPGYIPVQGFTPGFTPSLGVYDGGASATATATASGAVAPITNGVESRSASNTLGSSSSGTNNTFNAQDGVNRLSLAAAEARNTIIFSGPTVLGTDNQNIPSFDSSATAPRVEVAPSIVAPIFDTTVNSDGGASVSGDNGSGGG